MSELTDLEICKRIAEIEGKEFYLLESGEDTYPMIKAWSDSVFKDKCTPKRFFESHDYNPLTDDAILNQLIFKYEISISFNFCLISMVTNKQYEMNFTDIPSLKRKCLLLIIEAHKVKS